MLNISVASEIDVTIIGDYVPPVPEPIVPTEEESIEESI